VDAAAENRGLTMRAGARLRLSAIGDVEPRSFSVDRTQISIGTAAGNDLTIAGNGVSRRHATLARRSGRWEVTDQGSTNGTFVNGVKIDGRTVVNPGDEIAFGAARYRIMPAARTRGGWFTPARTAITVAILFALGFGGAELTFHADHEVASRDRETAPAAVARPRMTPTPAAPALVGKSAESPDAIATAAPVTATATPAAAPTVVIMAEPGAGGPWLVALNRYRSMAGLNPIAETDADSRADRAHARYLVKTYGANIRAGDNPGIKIHEEDSSSPWYSPAGAAAASHSDIAEWPGPAPPPSPSWAIDLWIAGPFHRLPMLNPLMRTASYGEYCENGVCVVLLDLAGALDRIPMNASMVHPVEFPPDGATTDLEGASGEWPDPLSSCPGYAEPTGLPISLQTAYFKPVKMKSFSLTRSDGAKLDACAIDATNYVNSDPQTQKRGRSILEAFGAVILIPRAPLRPDLYKVAISTDNGDYSWSFRTAP